MSYPSNNNNNNNPVVITQINRNLNDYRNPRPIVVVTNAYGVQQNYDQSQNSQQLQQQQIQQQQQQLPTQFTDDEANRYTWRTYKKKNRAQSNSITPACLLVSVGGIHSMYMYSYLQLRSLYTDYKEITLLLLSWFVAVILGAIISTFLIRTIQKNTFNYISSILTIISGIIFFTLDENYTAIVLTRFISGIAYGLILIPVIIHASEISVKKLRGSLIANIQICFMTGLLLGSIFYAIYLNNFNIIKIDINQLCGIGIICFSVMAFIFNTFMVIESPLYLIDKKQENDAFKNFLKLKNEKYETLQTRQDFNDLKQTYLDDTTTTFLPITRNNLKPLLLIGLLRGIYALLTSIPVNYTLYLNFFESLSSNDIYGLLIIRYIGEIISWIMIDRKGRRHILYASLLLSGICIILTGILYNRNVRSPDSIVILSFFYQFFLGLGIGSVSLTYMSEAFTFTKKPISLLLIIGFEHFIHILLIYIFIFDHFRFNLHIFFYVVGTITVIYSFICFKKLPETKNRTLRECHNMMR